MNSRLIFSQLLLLLLCSCTGLDSPSSASLPFFVKVERFHHFPASLDTIQTEVAPLTTNTWSARESALNDAISKEIASAGLAVSKPSRFLLVWHTSESADPVEIKSITSSSVQTGGSTSTSYISTPQGLKSVTTQHSGTTIRVPTEDTETHILRYFSLRLMMYDLQSDGAPEVFHGKCAIKSADRPIPLPLAFAVRELLRDFPGNPIVNREWETRSLTLPPPK